MAPARADSDDSNYSPPSLEEIIFSCGICQATVSELYPSDADNPHSHSSSGDDGMGTRLWIANCVHIFCGRHLDGGGVPFHSSSGPPQAICPVCVRIENNHEVRNLYGIRGLTEGKLDSAIPASYAKCPPVSLDGNDPGAEALRFQYSRLKTYSQEVTRRWKSAERKKRTLESTIHKERKQLRGLKAEHEELRTRLAEVTKKLQGWEGRKDQIKHYMGAVGDMARDVQTMREELVKLGYQIEHKTYGLEVQPSSHSKHRPFSGSARGDSSATLVDDHRGTSSSKRKRGEYDPYPDDKDVEHELAQDRANDMPPPPLPASETQPQMRPSAMPQASGNPMQSFRLDRHERPMQSKPYPSEATPFHTGGWQSRDRTVPLRQQLDPVPAMRSMKLNSGTPPYQPRRGNAVVSIRGGVAAEEQQFDQEGVPMELPTQPPRSQAVDSYSHSRIGRPPRHFEHSHADVMNMDTIQEGRSRPLEAYAAHPRVFHESPHPHSFAHPPPSVAPPNREPYMHGVCSRPDVSPQRRLTEQPGTSVLSPFFKGDNSRVRIEQMPPPSVRGADPRRGELPRGDKYATSPLNRSESSQHRFLAGPGLQNGSFSVPYATEHRQRVDADQPIPQRFGNMVQHHRYDNPRASQMYSRHTFSHPTQAIPPPVQAGSPAAQPYRTGRMTLPSLTSSRRGLDPQVSQIRGVRGAGPSPSSQYASQGAASSYSARGSMYSRAGSRSIVRR